VTGDDQTPPWTAADQACVEAFEDQILRVASQLNARHPDVIVVGFVQTLGSLIRRRLREDPSRLAFYRDTIGMLIEHIEASPPSSDVPASRMN